MGIRLFLILIALMSIGVANAAYMDDAQASSGDGIWFWINTSWFDSWTCCDSDTLSLGINGSTINFTIGSNKTITSPSFLSDNMTVTISGTAGYTNFSAIMASANTWYDLTANGVFSETKRTDVNSKVWFNYTGSYPTTLTISQNNGAPSITSNLNNLTGTSVADITVNINNAILFSVGSNQTITTWTWNGATKEGGDGTTNSTASKLFNVAGDVFVNVYGTNSKGSTQTITWTVHVVTDSSGLGTDWDYLTGTVNIAGATITTNPNVGSTAGGAYSYGYVFVRGNTYWINTSKTGYDDNNTQITFTSDHMIWNPTLTLSNQIPILTQNSPSAYYVAGSGSSITFTTSANAPITNYYWTEDGSSVTGTSTYTSSYTKGLHYIKVYADNSYGTSNTLEWRVSVNRLMAATAVPTINITPYNEIKIDIRSFNVTGALGHSIAPYSTALGSSPLLWIFLWLMVFCAYWIRQRQVTFPTVIALIFGGVIIGTLPEEYQIYAKGLVAIGMFAVVYMFFTERRQ